MRADNENIALPLTGVIKRDSFSVGRPFGRSVAVARLGALPNTGSIRVHNINFIVGPARLDETSQRICETCQLSMFSLFPAPLNGYPPVHREKANSCP